MGLVDVFAAEDRVDIKLSQLYNLMKAGTQYEMLMNAVKTRVPYEYIENVMTGKLADSQKEGTEE